MKCSASILAQPAQTHFPMSAVWPFRKGLSREDRITRFMQGAKNLYCYCVGGVGVKIEFAESGPSLQDTLGDFLIRAKSGL